ncbi:TonB family protein, partial [Polynucleobacter sp.]|uniref:beta strand repeat-containing protein n=1 Tax=Polynucleobacter sp. TaxID=2029855 RepID=UPI0030196AB4
LGSLTITAAPLNVVGANNKAVYSGSAQSNSGATVTGQVAGQSITVNDAASAYASVTNVATGKVADTSYALTYGFGVDSSNYSVNTTLGSLTITAAPLNVVGANNSLVYNGVLQTNSGAVVTINGNKATVTGTTITGLGTDTLTLTGYATGTNANSAPNPDNLGITANSNYSLVTVLNGSLTITPAPLGMALNATYNGTKTFTANSAVTTTGSIATGGSLTVNGLQASDNVTGVTLSDANVATANNLITTVSGSAGTTLWNGTSGNYIIHSRSNAGTGGNYANGIYSGTNTGNVNVNGTNTVSLTAAALGININAVYNGTNSFTVSSTGLVGGDALTGVTTYSANVADNATNYVTGISGTAGGTGGVNLSNYSISSGRVVSAGNTQNTALISPAPLGLTVTSTYNGTKGFTSTIASSGLQGGDTISGVTSYSANVADNATNYVTGISGTAGSVGAVNLTNYSIYNANNAGSTGINTGGVYSGTANTLTGVNSGGTNTVTLSAAPLGLAITSTYNGTNNFTNTITATGLVGGDVITSATTTALNVADNATNYVTGISGTAANGGAVNLSNYTISGGRVTTPGYTQNLVTLSGAPLAITVSGTYNGSTSFTNSNATINVAGLVGSETLVVTGVNVYSKDVAANGSNYVTGITSSTGSATLSNYAINSGYTAANSPLAARATASTTPNAVTISPAALNILNINADKTYDGTKDFYVIPVTLASNFTYSLTGMVNGDAAPTITGGNATVSSANANTYNSFVTNTFTLSNTNYTFSGGAVNATINKAPITISTSDVVKTYDASLSALGSAIVTSGTLYTNVSNSSTTDSLSGGTFAYANANAGSGNKTVTVASVTVNDGNNGNNYSVTYANNTTSTINKANLYLTGTQVYTASTSFAGSNLTATGVNSQTFAVTGSGDSSNLASANVQTGAALSSVTGLALGSSNNGGLSSNYNVLSPAGSYVSITKAPLTITGAVTSKIFTGSVQTNTYSTAGLLGSDNVSGVAGLASRTDVGTTADGLSNATGTGISNYQITFVNGSLTILAGSNPPPPPPEPPPPPTPPAPTPAVTTIQVVGQTMALAPIVSSASVTVNSSISPISGATPVYPAGAEASGKSGKVVLDITIDASGKVTKVTVVSSSGSGDLDSAAVTAAQSWVYAAVAPDSAPRTVTSEVAFSATRSSGKGGE